MEVDITEIISKMAYQLWQRAGKPEGQDQQIWFEAQKKCRDITENLIKLYHLIAECENRGVVFPNPMTFGAKDAAWLSVLRMIEMEIDI